MWLVIDCIPFIYNVLHIDLGPSSYTVKTNTQQIPKNDIENSSEFLTTF